ncbi:MAG TPA: hypothetical protein PLP48_08970 [Acholeplasmataceae bacterium]|nr:hypothetical protein [Acholeplasmataceae bacterium]
MENLFDPNLHCRQYQVGQQGVKHSVYGPCEVIKIEIYKGVLYYEIKVIESGLRVKCIGSKLSTEVQS